MAIIIKTDRKFLNKKISGIIEVVSIKIYLKYSYFEYLIPTQ